MASKKQELTPEQIRILRRNHLDPALWEVLQDYRQSMLVRRKDRSESKVLFKQQIST